MMLTGKFQTTTRQNILNKSDHKPKMFQSTTSAKWNEHKQKRPLNVKQQNHRWATKRNCHKHEYVLMMTNYVD